MINNYLETINWHEELSEQDININYSNLMRIYNDGVSKFIPTFSSVNSGKRTNPKWFNKSIKKLTKLKYKRFRCSRSAPNNQLINGQYRSVCRILRRSLKLARLEYEKKIISFSKDNPKLYIHTSITRKITPKRYALSSMGMEI